MPAIMVVGFVLAMIVNKGIHWKGAIRGMVFLPYVSNMVAVAVVFKILLGQSGPFYQIMQFFGVENPPLLLLSNKFALPTVALIAVWKGIGLNMITYLGALQNVPTELDEAAKIDGCNHFTIYARIITPLAKPSIATMILFSFVWTWNDYMSPYLYISDINKQMLSVGIKLFSAGQVQDYGSQMAAATLVLLPIIVVFLFCQRFFIENATSSGVKG